MNTDSGKGSVRVYTPNGSVIVAKGHVELAETRVNVVTPEGNAFSYPAPWCIITWGDDALPEDNNG